MVAWFLPDGSDVVGKCRQTFLLEKQALPKQAF